jgi:hypothetical protein
MYKTSDNLSHFAAAIPSQIFIGDIWHYDYLLKERAGPA